MSMHAAAECCGFLCEVQRITGIMCTVQRNIVNFYAITPMAETFVILDARGSGML